MTQKKRALPAESKRRVVVLGSTGSIGEKALSVVRRFPDRLSVIALHTHRKIERLAEQVASFKPAYVVVGDPAAAARFDRSCLPAGTVFLAGDDALPALARLEDADIVVNAVVGALSPRAGRWLSRTRSRSFWPESSSCARRVTPAP
jgi:1-deoxy-D-xylulose-5-phosphate reductoisomerase